VITTETARVYVIEGQVLFGKALCQVFSLDPTLQIVGDSETVYSAALAKAKPDLILLDVDGGAVELGEALAACRKVNRDGIAITLDHLGGLVPTGVRPILSDVFGTRGIRSRWRGERGRRP